MSEEKVSKWELFDESKTAATERLKVDGGHLYHVSYKNNSVAHSVMCFVPDVDLQRYQAHLRDAYKQGYKAGQDDAKHGISDNV